MSAEPIQLGDKGPDVGELQRLLNSHGAKLLVDDHFGGKTRTALVEFQVNHGLAGVADERTMKALRLMAIDTSPPFEPMSAARRASAFGRFDYRATGDGDKIQILGDWEERNIERFYISQLDGMPYYDPDGKMLCDGNVYLHKLAGPKFKKWLELCEDQGLIHLFKCYDGGFNARFIRGSKTSLSNHAWGTAMDFNAYANGLGKEPAPIGASGSLIQTVPLAHSCGIYWGGNFSRKDGMHFEIAVL